MVTTILFDMGGVLMRDAYTPFVKAHRRLLSTEQQGEFDKWEHLSATGKLSKEEYTEHFNEAFGKGSFEGVDQKVCEAITSKHNDRLIAKLPDLAKQYNLALLSNNMPWWSSLVKGLHFMKYFTPALFSDDIGMMKPYTPVYEYTAKLLGVEPKTVLFIDDSGGNIEIATKLGFQTIHYTNWGKLLTV